MGIGRWEKYSCSPATTRTLVNSIVEHILIYIGKDPIAEKW